MRNVAVVCQSKAFAAMLYRYRQSSMRPSTMITNQLHALNPVSRAKVNIELYVLYRHIRYASLARQPHPDGLVQYRLRLSPPLFMTVCLGPMLTLRYMHQTSELQETQSI